MDQNSSKMSFILVEIPYIPCLVKPVHLTQKKKGKKLVHLKEICIRKKGFTTEQFYS